MTNREKLQRLMKRYKLEPERVAKILDAKPDTVTSWLKPESSKSHRNIPGTKLKLLEILCQAQAGNKKAARESTRGNGA